MGPGGIPRLIGTFVRAIGFVWGVFRRSLVEVSMGAMDGWMRGWRWEYLPWLRFLNVGSNWKFWSIEAPKGVGSGILEDIGEL